VASRGLFHRSQIREPFLWPVLAAMAFAVVACNSSSNTRLPAPQVFASATLPAGVANREVSVHFLIPASISASNDHNRHLDYVSASTLSASVEVNNSSPPDITDLSPNSGSCTAAPNNARTCSIPIAAPNGNDTFDVRLLDAASGGGSILSRSTTVLNVDDNTQSLNFTLNGVVSRVQVASSTASIPAGTATTIPVTVTAYDADNNIIIPPGPLCQDDLVPAPRES